MELIHRTVFSGRESSENSDKCSKSECRRKEIFWPRNEELASYITAPGSQEFDKPHGLRG